MINESLEPSSAERARRHKDRCQCAEPETPNHPVALQQLRPRIDQLRLPVSIPGSVSFEAQMEEATVVLVSDQSRRAREDGQAGPGMGEKAPMSPAGRKQNVHLGWKP